MDYSTLLPARSNNLPMINYRKDAKKAIKFTFMVAGELGTGKSTFINCLLNRKVVPHTFEGTEHCDTKTLTFTLAHAVSLPNTSILARNKFDAFSAHEEPGIALTETTAEIVDDDNVRLHLNIIDTPGFGDNLNNDLCFVEIENYLKQQFDLVLAEETRIRRNPRFIDTRVHVLLYFITPTGHGLRELDILCMKRLSKYVNIIPVLGRADTFTEAELKHFKAQVRVDIERFNVPIFQFDNFMDDYDEDEDRDLIQECKFLAKLQPFAVVASEQDFEIKDTLTGETRTIKARQYPWGLVDVNNTKYSDFRILRSALFGSHLQDLKDLTHDFLYETYRTERLSKVTGKDNDDYGAASPELRNVLESVPSMSNLAQLTGGNDMSLQLDNKEEGEEDTSMASSPSKKSKTMLFDDTEEDIPAEAGSPTSNKQTKNDTAFKRLSIAPQRNQLRQISETVPYVIRHERILERQQKLEEMEIASAKELANRAALLEQKAAQLKAKEKMLLEKLEAYKRAESAKEALSANGDEASADYPLGEPDGDLHRDDTLNEINSVATQS